MKITISKPEYQILSDSTNQFKVQMKATDDATVPNRNLPQFWSDLDEKGEWGNPNSVGACCINQIFRVWYKIVFGLKQLCSGTVHENGRFSAFVQQAQ